jgi:predicted aspartyl protease
MSATTTIAFAAHHPWNRSQPGAPQDNRPYAEVLVGPNRARIFCLVDSGADRILLDSGFAAKAGVNLGAASRYRVQTVGGPITVDEVTSVALEIEGIALTDTCLFAVGAMPLLGRVTFLNAFKAGFDPHGWLHS